MTPYEVLLAVAAACLILYLVYVLRSGLRGTRIEEMTRLRQGGARDDRCQSDRLLRPDPAGGGTSNTSSIPS